MPATASTIFTRRRALVAAAGAAGAAYFGRFTVGGSFEQHVSEVLGLERPVTDELLELLRHDLSVDYDLRAAAFVAVTTAPGRWITPAGLKRQAIESFVGPFFGVVQGCATPFAYAGLRTSGFGGPCAGLRRQ